MGAGSESSVIDGTATGTCQSWAKTGKSRHEPSDLGLEADTSGSETEAAAF